MEFESSIETRLLQWNVLNESQQSDFGDCMQARERSLKTQARVESQKEALSGDGLVLLSLSLKTTARRFDSAAPRG